MRCTAALFGMIGGLAAGTGVAAPLLEVVLSGQDYPPYVGQTLSGNGLLARVVSRAFQLENVRVRYLFFPNNRALQSARNGTVDGSIGWEVTPERQRDLLYSDTVMTLRLVFFQRAEDRIVWHALPDLARYRIGVTLGNTYSQPFAQLQQAGVLHVETSADDLSNLRKLLARHIDLFPIDAEVGRMLLSRNFSAADQRRLVPQSTPFWTAGMHVVIWRGHPRAAELVERFNRGLKRLRASGEFGRLVDPERVDEGRPPG